MIDETDGVISMLFQLQEGRGFRDDSERLRTLLLILFDQAVVKKSEGYEQLYVLKKEREKENEETVERLRVS